MLILRLALSNSCNLWLAYCIDNCKLLLLDQQLVDVWRVVGGLPGVLRGAAPTLGWLCYCCRADGRCP